MIIQKNNKTYDEECSICMNPIKNKKELTVNCETKNLLMNSHNKLLNMFPKINSFFHY